MTTKDDKAQAAPQQEQVKDCCEAKRNKDDWCVMCDNGASEYCLYVNAAAHPQAAQPQDLSSYNAPESIDAKRYRRLQILGAAPGGSPQLERSNVLRFQALDAFVDADLDAHPSRGEAAQPQEAGQARDFLAWWTSIETDERKARIRNAMARTEYLHSLLRTAYEAGQAAPSVSADAELHADQEVMAWLIEGSGMRDVTLRQAVVENAKTYGYKITPLGRMPSVSADAKQLPPLPAPAGTMEMNWGTPYAYDVDGYTADQMRGYAIDATFAIQSNDGRLDAAIATQSKAQP